MPGTYTKEKETMDMNIVTPEEVGFSSTRLSRITTVMQGYVDQGRPPGIITAVVRRGKVVHLACFGTRDVEAGVPMRPDTILRIYSMSKPITSTPGPQGRASNSSTWNARSPYATC
jgi:CubicO group peptidase (beta-lactamase class C family)